MGTSQLRILTSCRQAEDKQKSNQGAEEQGHKEVGNANSVPTYRNDAHHDGQDNPCEEGLNKPFSIDLLDPVSFHAGLPFRLQAILHSSNKHDPALGLLCSRFVPIPLTLQYA